MGPIAIKNFVPVNLSLYKFLSYIDINYGISKSNWFTCSLLKGLDFLNDLNYIWIIIVLLLYTNFYFIYKSGWDNNTKYPSVEVLESVQLIFLKYLEFRRRSIIMGVYFPL